MTITTGYTNVLTDPVIDLTGFTGDQITAVRNYVNGLSSADQARIVRIGF